MIGLKAIAKTEALKYPILICVVSAFLSGATAFAQINSNSPTITLNATLAETLSMTASPTTVNFTLAPASTANGSAPVVITTTWVLASTRANIYLDGYFSSATAALSGGSPVVNIPSSEVYGLMATGSPTSYTAFTANTAFESTSSGLLLFTQALSSSTRNSTRTDNLLLQINLTSQPQLPAATYTGSLLLEVQAM